MLFAPPPDMLFHYTCRDRLPGIAADRVLIPHRSPVLNASLVWLTDLDVPDRGGLGLTADHLLTCDRTDVRVTVHSDPGVLRWPVWARIGRVPGAVRRTLESGRALPMHWWVTSRPVDVVAIEPRVPGLVVQR